MSVATGTAIAIGVGAMSAGTSLARAKMESNAAKQAAGLQTASQDRAQAFNQQVYNDQRQALNPYVQAGNASLERLMQQHWGSGGLSPGMKGTPAPQGQYLTPGSGYQAPAPGSMAPGMGDSPLAQAMGGDARMPGPNAQAMGQAVARQGLQGGGPGVPQGGGGPTAFNKASAAASAPGGGMVMMEGPDGSRQSVPQANVQAAIQRGARVVS